MCPQLDIHESLPSISEDDWFGYKTRNQYVAFVSWNTSWSSSDIYVRTP